MASGDRVVLFAGEFPANVTPWQRAARMFGLEIIWLCATDHLDGGDHPPAWALRTGRDALRHLFRVTSSLDSLVVGEDQILAQVKEAYQRSEAQRLCGQLLGPLFQTALHEGDDPRAMFARAPLVWGAREDGLTALVPCGFETRGGPEGRARWVTVDLSAAAAGSAPLLGEVLGGHPVGHALACVAVPGAGAPRAVGLDFMGALEWIELDAAGYDIVLSVHDELVFEVDDSDDVTIAKQMLEIQQIMERVTDRLKRPTKAGAVPFGVPMVVEPVLKRRSWGE